MNWIRSQAESGPKAEDYRDLLAKIEAGDETTALARKVKGFRDNYAHGDAEFALWMALVDHNLARKVGLGLFDLADWPMRDAFDDGMSPSEAAQEALRSDDTFGGF
jgi:hypothetical protein